MLCYLLILEINWIEHLCEQYQSDWSRIHSWTSWQYDMETLSALPAYFERNPLVPVDSPHNGRVRQSFADFFIVILTKLSHKHLSCVWFKTVWHTWCHSNGVCKPCRIMDFLFSHRVIAFRTIAKWPPFGRWHQLHYNIDGVVQDCSNPISNALESLQSCTKQWIFWFKVRVQI